MEENAQRWERLEELFAAAADLPRDRQDAFVEQETNSDPELRRELRALLDHDTGAGKRIAQAIQSAAPPPQWTGDRAGPYRIVREIGRGGMGVVFEAVRDDDEYRKTVALKIAPWCRNLDLLRERFRRERQILAGLEHPNIARLIDGGTHDDTPYFAMEFVEGRPITEYAAGRKLQEKIELFREVCAAVHHAHQSLVVHRDLKPANILVSEHGVPKLLDFGIAKLLGPSDADGTVTGIAPWTPDYASPEQIRGGPITTRTDVYSLGLILFEMLTGERAQIADSSSPRALDYSICEAETPRASSRAPGAVARQLAGDLDTIIARATQKEPERRYATVAEFSDDLGRYLDGRPVRARKDSTAYRASKFVRRNWLPVGATAVAMLGLAGGAIGFAWQARVANRSRAIAEQQRQAAEQQRDRATQEHRVAEQQRDAAVAAQAHAEEMAHEADAQRGRAAERTSQMAGLAQHAVFDLYGAIENLSGTLEARRAMLPATLKYIEQLRRDAGDDPEFLRLLGDAYMRVGDIQGGVGVPSLGDTAGALESYRKSIGILSPLAARYPSNARFRIGLIGSYNQMGKLLRSAGKPAEAIEFDRKAVDAARFEASLAPDNADAVRHVGDTAQELGRLLVSIGNPDRAEPYARESLEIFRRLAAKEPSNAGYLDDLVSTYSVLASIATLRNDLQATFDYVRQGTEIRERILRLKPDNTDIQRNLLISYGRMGDTLANALGNLGDPRTAVDYFRKCIALARQMLARDPQNQTARRDLATSQARAAQALSGAEQRAESLELYSQAAAGFEALVSNAPSNGDLRFMAGHTLGHMAFRFRSAGDAAQALDLLRHAIQHLTAPGASGSPNVPGELAWARALRALLLAEQGDRAGALEEAGRAAEIGTSGPGWGSKYRAAGMAYWMRVGEMYEALARKHDAPPDQQLADWRAARDAYQRSLTESRQTVQVRREVDVAELESRIASCEKEIASLTR